jgi:Ring finger domain
MKQDYHPMDEENGSGTQNFNLDSEFTVLQLDGSHPNANRQVSAVCIICLTSYEVHDSVSFSSNPACRHAFHTECITKWAAKEDKLLCPCCRQDFCSLIELEEPSSLILNET